jgi:hypothetical protein
VAIFDATLTPPFQRETFQREKTMKAGIARNTLVYAATFVVAANLLVIAWLVLRDTRAGETKADAKAGAKGGVPVSALRADIAGATGAAGAPSSTSFDRRRQVSTDAADAADATHAKAGTNAGAVSRLAIFGEPEITPPKKLQAFHIREERRQITFSAPLAELGRRVKNGGESGEIVFPLFDGKTVRLTDLQLDYISPDEGVFYAKVAGEPGGGDAQLSYVGSALSGRVHLPTQNLFFNIRNGGEPSTAPDGSTIASSYLTQEDPAKMPVCGVCAAYANASAKLQTKPRAKP